MHYFSADKPILKKEEDKLDRATYADKIAESLRGWHGDESLVVSLSGAWGAGKTSLKNLIKENLKNTTEDNTKPIIIEFNPWEWSSQHEIPKALLKEIETALKEEYQISWYYKFLAQIFYRRKKDEAPKIIKQARLSANLFKYRINVFSKKVSATATVLNSAFSELKTISLIIMMLGIAGIVWADSNLVKALCAGLLFCGFIVKWAAELLVHIFPEKAEKTFEEQKKEIREGLKTLTNNIIVFVDDLDRLEKQDLIEIFQLVKANCDFPNLVFFLLMDYEKTASLLNDDRNRGLDYLEKIIQIPLEVPPVEEMKIVEILEKEVQAIIKKYSLENKFEQDRWIDIFHQGLQPYFKNLRDVYRYISTANFYILANSNDGFLEVNPVDLLTIEAIRVFEPDAYEAISKNKFLLTEPQNSNDDITNELNEIIQKSKTEKQENFKFVLKSLFLTVNWALGGAHYASDFYGEWKRDTRICAEDYFDYYFQFKVPNGNLSAFEKEEILKSIDNENSFVKTLENLHTNGRLKIVLSFLDSVKKEIKTEQPQSLINALMIIGEKSNKFDDSYLEFDNFTYCCRIIYWFLKENYTEEDRYKYLSNSFKKNKSFAVMCMVIYYAAHDDDKESLLNDTHLDELKREWLHALKDNLHKNPLCILDNIRTLKILGAWEEYSNRSEVVKWFAENIEANSENLLKFLERITSKTTSQSIGSAVMRIDYELNRDVIERYTNFDNVVNKLNTLPLDSLNDNDKAIIGRVNKAFQKQKMPSFFNASINKGTLRQYSQWLYKDLPIKEKIEDLLIQDIDLRKYPTIASLDQAHSNAQGFLEWYKSKNPDAFQSGVDFLTKALGYEDDEFFARHAFGQKTRDAIKDFKNLESDNSKAI